jgi:hypothetical protein
MSIFDNGLAHLKAEKDEVEGQKADLPVIFDNGPAHLKAEKDEVEGQEGDRPDYIRQWTHPPEGREGRSKGTRRQPSCLYSTVARPHEGREG